MMGTWRRLAFRALLIAGKDWLLTADAPSFPANCSGRSSRRHSVRASRCTIFFSVGTASACWCQQALALRCATRRGVLRTRKAGVGAGSHAALLFEQLTLLITRRNAASAWTAAANCVRRTRSVLCQCFARVAAFRFTSRPTLSFLLFFSFVSSVILPTYNPGRPKLGRQ